MARIAGVELQDKWRIDFALTKIKGIGWSNAGVILKSTGIGGAKRVNKIDSEELAKLTKEIEKFEIEGDLIRVVRANIQRLKAIHAYRGIRHNQGLPTRGQRTKSNARTKRGAKKTVGSFRKEELAKQQVAKK